MFLIQMPKVRHCYSFITKKPKEHQHYYFVIIMQFVKIWDNELNVKKK
jgi:hypothetical protein